MTAATSSSPAAHGGKLLVPASVIVESSWQIEDRLGPAAEAAFLRSFPAGELTRVDLSEPDWERAVELIGGTLFAVSSSLPVRSEHELSPREHQALEAAHVELRAAVEAYEAYLGRELQPGADVPIVGADEMGAAQERVEAAERRLWELREQLLGWVRPSWAPPATLVSDWILEEDPGYDSEPDRFRR